MNKTVLDQMWDQFRQKYGVYLRLLDAIPADRFASHPIPGMPSFLSRNQMLPLVGRPSGGASWA